MMTITVYADTTGLFTEEECCEENLVDITVPKELVREWYKLYEDDFKSETMHELHIPMEEATFERWANDVCVADDFDGFFEFSEQQLGKKWKREEMGWQ